MRQNQVLGGFRIRMMRLVAVLIAAWSLLAARPAGAQNPGPSFALSFDPCPARVEVSAGQAFTAEFGLILTTTDNVDSEEGAQGWSVSLTADGMMITDITTAGTLGAETTDDPPGLRQVGFEKSELATPDSPCSGACDGRHGAVSAVVLSFTEGITLPPLGPALVARITMEGEAPIEQGETAPARVFYLDGCAGSG